jgi:hypothetical protein
MPIANMRRALGKFGPASTASGVLVLISIDWMSHERGPESIGLRRGIKPFVDERLAVSLALGGPKWACR